MKKTRKIFAVVLALVMCFAMALPAMAATITIEKSATVKASERQFKAYKILGASEAGNGEIAYTVPPLLGAFYSARYGLKVTDKNFSYEVAQKISEESNKDLYKFGDAVLKEAKDQDITGIDGKPNGENYVFENLDPGYYVIEDVTDGLKDGNVVSALILQSATDSKEVVIKTDTPKIDKKIDGDRDTVPGDQGLVDNNNASIGDMVPYVLTTSVPSMSGYDSYKYVITDTLSKGLKYNEGTLKVHLDNEELGADKYDLTVTGDGPTTIKIVFKNFIQYQDKAGAEIKVTYEATVDDDAVLGTTGNPNDVILNYSQDPKYEGMGDNDDFEPGEPKGETQKITVKTFVVGLEFNKVNSAGDALTGAQFAIKGERVHRTHVMGSAFEEITEAEYEGDVYYKLADGTYTKTVPTDATEDQYDQSVAVKTYKLVEKDYFDDSVDHVSGTLIVDENGKLVMEGLSAGTYEITEIVAPDGYNLLATPITVTINYDYDKNTKNCTWSGTYSFGDESGDLSFVEGTAHITGLNIVNYTGTELPGTGGIGTTIFYIVGIGIVVVAGVILVTRRRMGKNS